FKQLSTHRVGETKTQIRGYITAEILSDSTGLPTGCAHGARRFAQFLHIVIHRASCGAPTAPPSVGRRRKTARTVRVEESGLSVAPGSIDVPGEPPETAVRSRFTEGM